MNCKRIQIEKCRAFCQRKQKQATPAITDERIAGDVWTWAAIDAHTKIVPCWTLGKCDPETVYAFVSDLEERLTDRVQLTSDGLRSYLTAAAVCFGDNVDYGHLVKYYANDPEGQPRYGPAVCASCSKESVHGQPDLKHVSTLFIERQNLRKRMGMRASPDLLTPLVRK